MASDRENGKRAWDAAAVAVVCLMEKCLTPDELQAATTIIAAKVFEATTGTHADGGQEALAMHTDKVKELMHVIRMEAEARKGS